MTRATRLATFLAVLATTASLAVVAPSGAADPKAPADPDRTAALAALARVEAVFSATGSRRTVGGAGDDATLALRDLAFLVDDLPADDRARARALLKRPTEAGGDGNLEYQVAEATPVCGPVVCVHYVASTSDAPSLVDNSGNGVPDYVDQTLAILNRVHGKYVDAGYKRPKPDGTRGGGSNKVDVYIGDIDLGGLYGYCTTDDGQGNDFPWARYAYCVLDDDYANIDSGNSNLEELQVTAAHEYFHAVQYAYDAAEDGWLLEATAAWAEDELYDAVNDNRQYLNGSPLTNPQRSMDQFADDGWHYGVWIFFRYLSERFPASKAGLPTIVRDIWRRADGTSTPAKDYYSWQAVSAVLRTRKSSAPAEFASFSAANRRPRATYDEGSSQSYPAAPLAGTAALTARKPSVTARGPVDHLASATLRLVPQGLSAAGWKLRLRLALAPTARGSRAVIMVTAKNGRVRRVPVTLNGQGDATRVVAFSTGAVRNVEVTLVNASGRFTCWQGRRFSCQGVSRDNNLSQGFTATAFR